MSNMSSIAIGLATGFGVSGIVMGTGYVCYKIGKGGQKIVDNRQINALLNAEHNNIYEYDGTTYPCPNTTLAQEMDASKRSLRQVLSFDAHTKTCSVQLIPVLTPGR